MRGAVALAAALAIPLETDTGAAFPGRELIIFLAFCVILFTLVGQGMTLPALIRALRIEDDGLVHDLVTPYGARAAVHYERGVPPVVNDASASSTGMVLTVLGPISSSTYITSR